MSPGLESLGRGELHRIFGNGPGTENQETRVEQDREIRQIRDENEIRNTYPDRALILRFLVAVFRARGIVLSLEDCPEAAPLVSARWLEAASTDDSSPAAASWPGISTWGTGDSSLAAGEDDPRAAPSRERFANDPPAALGSSGATVAPSSSSHR